jgi:hypothetical protein
MSIQKKLIEDILSSYDIINENKNMVFEVVDTYSNINFLDRKVGNSTPSKDNISTTLLQDVQNAAKSVGLMVDVTTAVSGHRPSKRHGAGQAVDIAQINNKPVSPSNRADADKLVNALVSMGYAKNSEGSNQKAVLTFGFEGHDDHVHVSNTGGASTQQPTTSGSTSTGTETSTTGTETSTTGTETHWATGKDYTGGAGKFARDIGSKILDVIGIKESFEPSSFGNNVQSNKGRLMIPKKTNSKIKSPVSGVIVDINTSQSCINQTVIEFSEGYLEYCGITNPSLKTGDKVRVGNSLGTTNSNVTVTLFSRKKNKKDIELDNEEPTDSKPKNRESLLVKGYHNLKKSSKEKEPETKSNNTKNSNYLLVRGYQKLKKSFDKTPNKKLDENIERIKGLLK